MEQQKIFKVCLLEPYNRINKVFVFHPDINPEEVFSQTELDRIRKDDTIIQYSQQQIHIDDSIRVIKNKILRELGMNMISYKELYLFSQIVQSIPLFSIYQNITSNGELPFTKDILNQLILNFGLENNIVLEKETYTFNELLQILPKEIIIKMPFGQKFEKEYDYLFSANPYDLKYEFPILPLFSLENSLLLNYGNLYENTIFVCLANDVFEYAVQNKIRESYISQYYFPLLYKNEIRGLSNLLENKQRLISESAISNDTWKLYETVDLFYDIYNGRSQDFSYFNNGISYFKIIIKTGFTNVLPLGVIFKNIHSTKDIPFIKYNPGFKRENIYRLYSEKISKNGKKIPHLPSADIIKSAKEVGKSGEISLFVKEMFRGSLIHMYIDFQKDGNLYIHSSLQTPITVLELNDLLKEILNPVIVEINTSLEQTGYFIPTFENIESNNIEINKIKFTSSIKITKKIDFDKFSGCISSIFLIESNDISSETGANLRFKRVENYQEMNPIDEYINSEVNKQVEIEEIIYGIVKTFSMDEMEARNNVIAFFKEHATLNGKVVENSGFPISIRLLSAENTLVFNIDNIIAIDYIHVLQIYLDSILRIYQSPETTSVDIQKTCKKDINFKNVDKPTIENVVAPVPKEVEFDSDFFKQTNIDNRKMESDDENEDDELFGMDVDEGEYYGGNDDNLELENNVEGDKLKNPNPFQKRIEDRDPALILKTERGQYNRYSKVCPHAANRQTVILDKTDKERIDKTHPGSYTTALEYGSDPNRPFFYICPRYWSLKTNSSLSQTEVDEILKTNPNAIIPQKEKTVPKGAFIYEFNTAKEHMNEKGEYIPHYPGLIKDSHPDGYSIPCCFKKQQNIQEDKAKRVNYYVISANSFPIPLDRWGFLPSQLQIFLKTDNTKCVSKTNTAVIKPNAPCLLRYGVEQSANQSFIGCFADIYAHEHGLVEIPSIRKMRKIISKAITLDMFIKYQNSSLISIFKPKYVKSNPESYKKYTNSDFVQLINLENNYELDFLNETIQSYENFIKFLNDDYSHIDHTYMWDIISMPNDSLIKKGLNLVILQMTRDSDTIELLCPTNSYSNKLFDASNGTLLLLKQSEFYEPIYLYENKDGEPHDVKLFYKQFSSENIKHTLDIIEHNMNNYCKAKSSLPNLYDFKKNSSPVEIIKLLTENGFIIHQQVINYQSKVIGLVVSEKESDNKIFIPCSPSPILNDYDIEFIDDPSLWRDYDTTIQMLNLVNNRTNHKINCLPYKKIVESNKIIGLLTKTNQYIRITPPIDESEVKSDNLIKINGVDYIEADKIVTTNQPMDKNRVDSVRNITLETQFYSVFRNTLRILLGQYENRFVRNKIIDLLENMTYNYNQKIQFMTDILRELLENHVSFQEMDPEIVPVLYEITTCMSNCSQKKYCLMKDNGLCQLILPKQNLIMGMDNEVLYYGKIADELLRYRRIRSFILEPNNYLNLTNIDYKVNDNEVLLLESSINSEYFSDLQLFNTDEYIQNISYDIAEPDKSISQPYSNRVSLK